jgi:hypothetical protein
LLQIKRELAKEMELEDLLNGLVEWYYDQLCNANIIQRYNSTSGFKHYTLEKINPDKKDILPFISARELMFMYPAEMAAFIAEEAARQALKKAEPPEHTPEMEQLIRMAKENAAKAVEAK